MKFKAEDMRGLIESLQELQDHAQGFGKLVAAVLAVEIGSSRLRAVYDGNEWELKEDDDADGQTSGA